VALLVAAAAADGGAQPAAAPTAPLSSGRPEQQQPGIPTEGMELLAPSDQAAAAQRPGPPSGCLESRATIADLETLRP